MLITIPVCWQAILHLRPVGDASQRPWCNYFGGALSMWPAFIWHDYSWGRAWGKYSGSRAKSAAGTELDPAESIVASSARAPSLTASMSAISIKTISREAPTSSIALVEAEGIHLCYNLMHVFMHQILLGVGMGKLLLSTLTRSGCS